MRIPSIPPSLPCLIKMIMADKPATYLEELVTAQIGPTIHGQYRHWHKLQYLTPPNGFDHERWWFAIKMARGPLLKSFSLVDKKGVPFKYAVPSEADEMLHRIDQDASGTIRAPEPVINPNTRDTYLVRSLIEEAITSSQLEGAVTTMKKAKQMIVENRKPQTRDEQMIFNNYQAMKFIRRMKAMPLSTQSIFELHRILTEKTLDDPKEAGRFRTSTEEIAVRDEKGQALHVPPDADELPKRLGVMCEFANNNQKTPFIHPVIKAILLHFWLGYDHPFVDGNGRTARALFYWSMLNQGYWLADYLSISKILRTMPVRYARSFLYCETDDNDATYFVLFQLSIFLCALDRLYAYLEKKTQEIQDTEKLISQSEHLRDRLNHRQSAVLNYAIQHPRAEFTIRGHRTRHNISYQTARTDLLELTDKSLRLLVKRRKGNQFVFRAPADLRVRLKTVA